MTWSLTYQRRPWTLNVERQGNRWRRAAMVSEWRQAFAVLARKHHVPALPAIAVTVSPTLRTARSVPDTAACVGAVKAAIDGLVDAGVLPDDGPRYVRQVTFDAPEVDGNPDALTITIHEAHT